jgi:hypothetical protein
MECPANRANADAQLLRNLPPRCPRRSQAGNLVGVHHCAWMPKASQRHKRYTIGPPLRSYGIRRTGKGDSAAPLAKQGFGLRCAARTANEQ